MMTDSGGIQQDVGGLVVHPLGGAPQVALRNHTQKRLIGVQRHLAVERGKRTSDGESSAQA